MVLPVAGLLLQVVDAEIEDNGYGAKSFLRCDAAVLIALRITGSFSLSRHKKADNDEKET